MIRVTNDILRNGNMYLRKVDLDDSYDYYEFCKDPEVTTFLTFDAYTSIKMMQKTIGNMIRGFLCNESINYSIFYDGKIIGSISLTFKGDDAEIGIIINKNYWHQGLGTKAMQLVINYAFNTLGVKTLYANYITDNTASSKLLYKLGFSIYKVEKNGFKKNNIFYDLAYTCLENLK